MQNTARSRLHSIFAGRFMRRECAGIIPVEWTDAVIQLSLASLYQFFERLRSAHPGTNFFGVKTSKSLSDNRFRYLTTACNVALPCSNDPERLSQADGSACRGLVFLNNCERATLLTIYFDIESGALRSKTAQTSRPR
jgi:hypothetical protein